ncbi:CPBP family intramembrane glutamic endopeptidase [Leifsonia flava]|uniref:CPBP family intramembrane metalloprotease n=1 Tax=Orlajensenia leifsoniae TaxID=2561933 RepID=A0A4Y9QSJ5_9MICO|nr:type II CAAX endopeptidase family protein [Leifsonia flava]TFV94858.1 CPBP family intramembrane metalloprotease [Leifsonia flava]
MPVNRSVSVVGVQLSKVENSGTIDRDARGWRGFWNRGGLLKALLIAIVYVILYNLAGLLLIPVVGGLISDDYLSDPLSAFIVIGLQPLVGSVVLIIFALSLGWLPRPLFGRQPPLSRKWWFWVAPVLILIPIVFHFFGIDYARYGIAVVLSVLLAGLFVGFSEDFVTRGMAVVLLRRRGYREWAVMALSSLIFAGMHLSNLIAGQDISTVGPIVIYTFAFGVCMYATLRAGGNLIWPIILHGLTDPTSILAAGGIDDSTHATFNSSNMVAVVGTVGYVVWAAVLLIITRGNAQGRADADEEPRELVKRPA